MSQYLDTDGHCPLSSPHGPTLVQRIIREPPNGCNHAMPSYVSGNTLRFSIKSLMKSFMERQENHYRFLTSMIVRID